MFNDYHIKEQDLRARMSQAQEKLEAIKARDAAIQDFNNFKSSLPKKLNEFELITLISNYAKLYHVTIILLSLLRARTWVYMMSSMSVLMRCLIILKT